MTSLSARVPAALRAAARHAESRRIAGAFLVGGLAFFVLGTPPTRLPPPAPEAAAWRVPALDAADATPWEGPVWASEPAPSAAGPAVAPQPRLLGTVRVDGRWRAVFQMPDGRRVRAVEGERLPDGAEIIAVAPTRATWRDAQGGTHSARLLDARQP